MDNKTKKAPHIDLEFFQSQSQGVKIGRLLFEKSGCKCPPFKSTLFHVPPGCSTVVDQHAVHESWIVISGEGELIYDAVSTNIIAGDCLYFEPYKTHQVNNSQPNTLSICSLYWE